MIASHFKTKIAVGDKLENSMICAIAGVGNMPYLKTETYSTRLLNRKEMKKVMAIFVRATKDLPHMLVKEVDTPYNAFSKLEGKYSI